MSTGASHAAPDSTLAPIILWVEDRLTKEYLHKVWQDTEKLLDIRIGGGNESVRAVVHDQRKQGYANVFGFMDRDFRPSNIGRWSASDSNLEVFVPDVHEIENYLLDWAALGGCDENHWGRSQAEIEGKARTYANTMICWMSCRTVIAKYRNDVCDGFPAHPKIADIPDTAAAETFIQTQPWYRTIGTKVTTLVAVGALHVEITTAHAACVTAFSSGNWKNEFSGKELFRHLRGFMLNRGGAAPEELDVDLAKSVGEWQYNNSRVPQDMLDLRIALRTRAEV